MTQQGKTVSDGRLTGQILIDQLVRNMEVGQFEMGYSILLPCVFSLYLHPDDYNRLSGVLDLIKDDARRALSARLAQLNEKLFTFGIRRGSRKQHRIACKDWALEFFADAEGTVPLGDVEIHSDLNETPQPGYHGAKTTLLDREPSVNDATREAARRPERAWAEFRYEDDSGPQLYVMTREMVTVGRGGDNLSVDLALYTNDEVSREHLRVRRDPDHGEFFLLDISRNGTWLNGRRLNKGVEERLPDRAQIGVAEVLTLSFEAKR